MKEKWVLLRPLFSVPLEVRYILQKGFCYFDNKYLSPEYWHGFVWGMLILIRDIVGRPWASSMNLATKEKKRNQMLLSVSEVTINVTISFQPFLPGLVCCSLLLASTRLSWTHCSITHSLRHVPLSASSNCFIRYTLITICMKDWLVLSRAHEGLGTRRRLTLLNYN